jgi:DNA processing protein
VTFRVISPASVDYPDSLHALGDTMPAQLFALGDVSHMSPPTVAIVGTRNATAYGTRVTTALASAFASAGVSVISGMARGIDAAAHRAALEVGGRTVAVLGTGIDVPYPAAHRELHRIISERGCVVSEYGAGVGARPGTFPRRNRIIAALAPLTIVVEAGHKSGALLTAGFAESLNRIVAAVPGPIDSPQSAGSNHLLRDRVQMIASVADALALAGLASPHERAPVHLSEIDARVWKSLVSGPLSTDQIVQAAKVTTRECLASITSLELDGRVEVLLTGEVRRR